MYNRTRELLAEQEPKEDEVTVPQWRTWRLKFEKWAALEVFRAYFGSEDGSEEDNGKAKESSDKSPQEGQQTKGGEKAGEAYEKASEARCTREAYEKADE